MKIIIAPTDRVLVRIKYGLEQSLEWSRGRKSYRVGSGLGKHLLVNESFIFFFSLQVVDSRSLRTDALIGEFRVIVYFLRSQSLLPYPC